MPVTLCSNERGSSDSGITGNGTKLSPNQSAPRKNTTAPVIIPPGINFAIPLTEIMSPKIIIPIAIGRIFTGRGALGAGSGIGGGGGV
jgi:hypothetical protein